MKKLFITVVGFLLLSSGAVIAQEPVMMEPPSDVHRGLIGFRFMPTISSLEVRNSSGVIEADFTAGFGFGGLIGYNFNKNVGLQMEFQYNRLSQKYQDADIERRVDLDYINIPLLFSLNTNREGPVNLNAVIGPQLGVNVGAKVSTSGSSEDGTNVRAILAVKESDFGFAYGLGLDFALNRERSTRLDLGFRGVQGLVDISDDSGTTETGSYYILQKSYIKSYSVYAGLTFLIF